VAPDHAGENHFFQVGTLDALLDARYDGDFSIGELGTHGTHGIGTLNALNGELVLIDGEFFQMTVDGVAHRISSQRETPFALVTFFEDDASMQLAGEHSRAEIEAAVLELSGDPQTAIAVRLDGEFRNATARSAIPERTPYRPFPEAVADNQRKFTLGDVQGSMIGFRFPEAAEGIQVPGFHLHLIDDRRTRGGHVLDYSARNVSISIQRAKILQIEFPAGVEPAEPGLTPGQLKSIHSVEG
jgi:acetolactate decarboxylase